MIIFQTATHSNQHYDKKNLSTRRKSSTFAAAFEQITDCPMV